MRHYLPIDCKVDEPDSNVRVLGPDRPFHAALHIGLCSLLEFLIGIEGPFEVGQLAVSSSQIEIELWGFLRFDLKLFKITNGLFEVLLTVGDEFSTVNSVRPVRFLFD